MKEKKKQSVPPQKTSKKLPAEDNLMPPSQKKFPIVGLGASAGGLKALKAFFAAINSDINVAYIVVIHMTPKQPSIMAELLQKVTTVPVLTAEDGQKILADHIYVLPPDKEISIYHGHIHLLDIVGKKNLLPIDIFFKSLGRDQKENAVAIILSGTGTDGTLGIKEIKANHGLILVQDEASADYEGMPRSAIGTGLVDAVLPPQEMFSKLVQYFSSHHHIDHMKPHFESAMEGQNQLRKIFAVLRAQTSHDFSAYKLNTMLRRISRRMGLNQIADHSNYVRYLHKNPQEVEALFRELLIGVTNFFRDKESFDLLKEVIIPEALDRVGEDGTFRAWIPGCSTGEEVYSLAMVIIECLDKIPKRVNLQLFGTDIDNHAIEKAREGLFPSSIAADIDAERLRRFFKNEGDFYRVRKEIRDHVVFSVQDVIKDPPFSRLNLLCCRNLLIYLNAETQKKILPLFHYTLSPEGILVLGSSETIGGFTNLFDIIDKKWKIFRRREVPKALRQMVDFPSGTTLQDNACGLSSPNELSPKSDIAVLTQQALLKQFVPTAVLTTPKGDILYIQGRTGKYLEASSGLPSYNILDLAREGLRIELSSAIRSARSSNKEVIRRRISVKTNGDTQTINLRVYPQSAPKELAGRLLVVFEDTDTDTEEKPLEKEPARRKGTTTKASKITELEQELQNTRESHQTAIEELESSNEELKSTNEELQSTNEELQSTNEELESSKEELQSLNEELHTVNAELQSKMEDLSAAHDDMHNLLNSTEIATIFVDNELRVRRFTPEATSIVNLIQTDIGRPLQHIMHNLVYEDLIADLIDVLKKLTPRNIEVQTKGGKWYDMRILPYRTMDNRIDGAVLTFTDIQDQKTVQEKLNRSIHTIEQAKELTRAVFDLNPDPMLVIEKDGRMVIANTAFSNFTQMPQKKIEDGFLFETENQLLKKILLQSNLKEYLIKEENFKTPCFRIEELEQKDSICIHGSFIKKNNNFHPCVLLRFIKERQKEGGQADVSHQGD